MLFKDFAVNQNLNISIKGGSKNVDYFLNAGIFYENGIIRQPKEDKLDVVNPHQVDAALFAVKSPLSTGALLADEVGLGKTIEAGLVLAQCWAERRRNILLIVPAALRMQWRSELFEKFYIDSLLMESAVYNKLRKEGVTNPFDVRDRVVICSYQFAGVNYGGQSGIAISSSGNDRLTWE